MTDLEKDFVDDIISLINSANMDMTQYDVFKEYNSLCEELCKPNFLTKKSLHNERDMSDFLTQNHRTKFRRNMNKIEVINADQLKSSHVKELIDNTEVRVKRGKNPNKPTGLFSPKNAVFNDRENDKNGDNDRFRVRKNQRNFNNHGDQSWKRNPLDNKSHINEFRGGYRGRGRGRGRGAFRGRGVDQQRGGPHSFNRNFDLREQLNSRAKSDYNRDLREQLSPRKRGDHNRDLREQLNSRRNRAQNKENQKNSRFNENKNRRYSEGSKNINRNPLLEYDDPDMITRNLNKLTIKPKIVEKISCPEQSSKKKKEKIKFNPGFNPLWEDYTKNFSGGIDKSMRMSTEDLCTIVQEIEQIDDEDWLQMNEVFDEYLSMKKNTEKLNIKHLFNEIQLTLQVNLMPQLFANHFQQLVYNGVNEKDYQTVFIEILRQIFAQDFSAMKEILIDLSSSLKMKADKFDWINLLTTEQLKFMAKYLKKFLSEYSDTGDISDWLLSIYGVSYNKDHNCYEFYIDRTDILAYDFVHQNVVNSKDLLKKIDPQEIYQAIAYKYGLTMDKFHHMMNAYKNYMEDKREKNYVCSRKLKPGSNGRAVQLLADTKAFNEIYTDEGALQFYIQVVGEKDELDKDKYHYMEKKLAEHRVRR